MMRCAVALTVLLSFAACAAGADPKRADRYESGIHFIRKPAFKAGDLPDGSFGDFLCRLAQSSVRGLRCPPSLDGGQITSRGPAGSGRPGATSKVIANLPHLKLAIILTQMENSIVSNGGVQQSEEVLDLVRASFKIESMATSDSLPAMADDPYFLPVPDAGDSWPVTHNNALFQGIILNGCLSGTGFDLTLESGIITVGGEDFGDVSLADEVATHGFYGFRYSIRATDPDGGVSDFIFSGDAIAWCTSDDSL